MKFSQIEEITKASVRSALREVYSDLFEEEEKTKQNKTSKEIDDLNVRAEKDDASLDEEETEPDVVSNTGQEKIEDKPDIVVPDKLPDVLEPESIIKSINVIRSGNSLKDKDVLSRFSAYFDQLNSSEKIALKSFMDGLAQVIAGDTPGDKAKDPSSPPYNVDMTNKSDQRTDAETIKKNSGSLPKKSQAPDAPIVVGESANKLWVKNVFKKNRL